MALIGGRSSGVGLASGARAIVAGGHRHAGLAVLTAAALGVAIAAATADAASAGPYAAAVERASGLETLRTLHISRDGSVELAEAFNGASTGAPTNIKSASKSLVSTLVGMAIERGILQGVDQPMAPLLRDQLPRSPDPRMARITIGNLLSMQAGLERTSGANYGAWVASDNWVRSALDRPFVDEPGGRMLYSTGSSHLLSAILTRETGRSTRALANDWLAPAGIRVDDWTTDPQGIPLGGNQVSMTPASLLALGELYRRDGRGLNGERILPERWIRESWTMRTRSRFTGDGYGYGWFVRDFGGHTGYYGWGYGGQMIYVIPGLELTVAITSDTTRPSGRTGYRDALHRLVTETIVPAAAINLAAALREVEVAVPRPTTARAGGTPSWQCGPQTATSRVSVAGCATLGRGNASPRRRAP